ncbi:MAG: hypothetical protein P4L63_00020 [Candidatus Pacebacteria bacterium]|nr:hypothetical protein [Candidatus Paceibacterota bacterium]
MQKRNVLNSARLLELKKNRKKNFLNKILFSFLGILVVFILLAFLSRLSSLNIQNIEVTGNQIVDTNAIKQEIEQEMSGKYFWLFPKTNIFLYPQNMIVKDLQNKFKRLENISLSIKNDKTLAVSVSERKALYTWCGNTPPSVSNVGIQQDESLTSVNTCYFVDENGYIFDQAPYFSGEVYFKLYGAPDVGRQDASTRPTSGGLSTDGNDSDPSGSYFSEQYFKQLIVFKNILVGFGLKSISLYVTPDQDAEVFLANQAPSTNEPEIIFKLNGDYDNIAENLEAALTTEPLQTQFKNKYSTLQYIDLRFGNKVYYKFTTSPAVTQ